MPVHLERAKRGRARAGLESERNAAAEWQQRWHAALVGLEARGVRAGAKGTSGGGPVAQVEPGWPEARQLRSLPDTFRGERSQVKNEIVLPRKRRNSITLEDDLN